MKTASTAAGQRIFKYDGDITKGVTLHFNKLTVYLPAELFSAVLSKFSNKKVLGGFSMTEPPIDGLGYFVREYSKEQLDKSISPRYASHIAAILREEKLVEITKESRSTIITFK